MNRQVGLAPLIIPLIGGIAAVLGPAIGGIFGAVESDKAKKAQEEQLKAAQKMQEEKLEYYKKMMPYFIGGGVLVAIVISKGISKKNRNE